MDRRIEDLEKLVETLEADYFRAEENRCAMYEELEELKKNARPPRDPHVTFPDVGAYECDAPDCGCPNGHFSYKFGKYDDGSEYLVVYLTCEWGHTTTLRLNNHDGAILYHVHRVQEEGWDG